MHEDKTDRPKRNTVRSRARETGAKYYYGAVCPKHPELNGKRRTSNAACPGCAHDYYTDNKATLLPRQREYDRARYARRQAAKAAKANTIATNEAKKLRGGNRR